MKLKRFVQRLSPTPCIHQTNEIETFRPAPKPYNLNPAGTFGHFSAAFCTMLCSLTTECVLLLQNVFSYYRMCSLTTECVLLLRMCSLTIERLLLLCIGTFGHFSAAFFTMFQCVTGMCVCIYVHTHTHTHTHTHVCVCMRRFSPCFSASQVCVYLCTHIHIHMYTCVYVCVVCILRRFSPQDSALQVQERCPLTTECVLLLQNVFSYYRMCSLTIERDTHIIA